MAGESIRDIKTNITSVKSTMQITEALELVAVSRLRTAKERVSGARPFYKLLNETIKEMMKNDTGNTVYTSQRKEKNPCYLVIAGDRGLAGGYNNNIFKLAEEKIGRDSRILPIGKKAVEYFTFYKRDILTSEYDRAGKMQLDDCYRTALYLCDCYKKHEIDSVSILYTDFVSMLYQRPLIKKLLPLTYENKEEQRSTTVPLFEPSEEIVFQSIVPQYLGGMLWGAVTESVASELAARRVAMESANDNAEEMIKDLNLKYNRVRQSAITQELTELMAGAEILRNR